MGDLLETAEWFARSVNLTSANTSLEKIINSKKLNKKDIESLNYAASIISGADRDSPYHHETSLDILQQGEVAVEFYHVLTSVMKYKQRPEFLDNFYLFLKSGGKRSIGELELERGKKLIKEMSSHCLNKVRDYKY